MGKGGIGMQGEIKNGVVSQSNTTSERKLVTYIKLNLVERFIAVKPA